LESAHERSQQIIECASLGSRERTEELLFIRHVGGDSLVDDGLAAPGQSHEGASPVVGIGVALGCNASATTRSRVPVIGIMQG
jgi:hypothetical protein